MSCESFLKQTNQKRLKDFSIYYINDENTLYEELTKGLDYEFVVFCSQSDIKLIRELCDLFKNSKTISEEKKWELIKIIERMPNRIIIIGENPWCNKKPKTPFQQWVTKRIAWINSINLNNLELEPNDFFTNIYNNLTSEQKFKLKLYETWIKHLMKIKDIDEIDFSINLKKSPSGDSVKLDFGEKRNELFTALKALANEEANLNYSSNEIWSIINLIENGKWLNDLKECIEKKHLNLVISDYEKNILKYCKNNNIKKKSLDFQFYLYFQKKIKKEIFTQLLKDLKIINVDQKIPFIFSRDKNNLTSDTSEILEHPFSLERRETTNLKKKFKISYLRHGNECDNCDYFEPLTGNATHFSIVESTLSQKNFNFLKFLYTLIENALLKMCFIDERIAKFFINKKSMWKNLKHLGIAIANNIDNLKIMPNKSLDLGNFTEGESLCASPNSEILIIHQGILDKIKSNAKLTDNQLRETIQFWRENYFPFIIVTSGRGTPDSIYGENVKFVPFSAIEQNLFTAFPSKIVLSLIFNKAISLLKEKKNE